MKALTIEIINQTEFHHCPTEDQFNLWLDAALKLEIISDRVHQSSRDTITCVIVNTSDMIDLNTEFRNKAKTTNVLSFPDEPHPGELPTSWGDIVFCYQTIQNEAKDLKINFLDHFAHLTIHGFLHLLGYDHQNDKEADEMESLEILALQKLQINNPYKNN